MEAIMLTGLFWTSQFIIVFIAINPVWRFLQYQWALRRREFYHRLHGRPLVLYLLRFREQSSQEVAQAGEGEFDRLYNRIVGRQLYIVPTALLFLTLFTLAGLVVSTAVRTGYERYLLFYLDWLKSEGTLGQGVQITRYTIEQLNDTLWPFPTIVLSLESLAAISGAYMYVVGVLIQGYRARTLVPS